MQRRNALAAPDQCARAAAPARPEAILLLDAFGRITLAPAGEPAAPSERLTRRVARALGLLVGRPIEVLSARAHHIGHQHVVTVASRELGRRGPELRTGVARHHDAARACTSAIVAAHLGDDTLCGAAISRFVADGILRSAVLTEGGLRRCFGAADRHDLLAGMACAWRTPETRHPPATDPSTVILAVGTTTLAAEVAPGADARAVHTWWRHVIRCSPATRPYGEAHR